MWHNSLPLVSVILVWAVAIPGAVATPPDITFLCDEMPEVCANMCWAVRCASPSFSQHLTLDFANADVQAQRCASAGCAGPDNKCSAKRGQGKPGHRDAKHTACNEYPFSSTSESTFPHGHQVSRCVPATEQAIQLAELSALMKKHKAKGGRHAISINFGNPGKARYCNNEPCENDGFQVQDSTTKRPSKKHEFKYYKTRSGLMLASIDSLETPSNFTRRVGNNEVLAAGFDTWHDADAGNEGMLMMGDTILEEVSALLFSG